MEEGKKEMFDKAAKTFGDSSGEIHIAAIHETTIVRMNMMEDENYRPYCGNDKCIGRYPRVGKDFICPSCGWVAKFDPGFLGRYKKKWGIVNDDQDTV